MFIRTHLKRSNMTQLARKNSFFYDIWHLKNHDFQIFMILMKNSIFQDFFLLNVSRPKHLFWWSTFDRTNSVPESDEFIAICSMKWNFSVKF